MADWLLEYKAKLKEVENLLQECEELLRSKGIHGPGQHPTIDDEEKIRVPRGYIRPAKYFREAYALPDVIDELSTRNNIAFALQLTDFFNYIINRFNVGSLSVGTSFYRTTTSHIFSIIESLLYGMVAALHDKCVFEDNVCRLNTKCEYYLNSTKGLSFAKMVNLIREKKLMEISDEEFESLMELKGIRDRIHMWDAGSSDFHDVKFSIENYNDAILLLTRIRDNVVGEFKTFQAQQAFGCDDMKERKF